jgi:uncharacterized membrane protein YfcA
MAIGLPVGMYLFRAFDIIFLKKILVYFIIVTSAWQLFLRLGHKNSKKTLSQGIKRLPYFALLIIGGIVHGMFSTGGPLVVIYASRTLPDKGQFRATLCLLWAV